MSSAYIDALDIIEKWVQEGDDEKCLFLSGKALKTLPPLPDNVKHLQIYDTSITYIPNPLPYDLEILKITCTPITSLPFLPFSLRILCIDKTNVFYITEFPPNLISFSAYSSMISFLPQICPIFLKKICICNTNIKQISHLYSKCNICTGEDGHDYQRVRLRSPPTISFTN